MELKELLSNIYPEKDSVITSELLEKYQLTGVLQIAINKIIINCKEPKFLADSTNAIKEISVLSLGFLVAVNSKLATISEIHEKQELELVISDVAFELLKMVMSNYKGENVALLQAINDSLKTACEFNGYNFELLQKVFPVKKFIAIQPAKATEVMLVKSSWKPIYYKWNGLTVNLDELSINLKNRNIIQKKNEFYRLFEAPKDIFTVSFNRSFRDELIVLFDTLYEMKHLSPVGNKGHFMPLKQYAVDFENNKLINSEPKKIKFTLKKNSTKWRELNETVGNWIEKFKK